MRRLALTPVLAAALVVSIAGCGSSSGSSVTPGGAEASGSGSQIGGGASEEGEEREGGSAAHEAEEKLEEHERPSGEGVEGSSETHELERAKELFEEGEASGEGAPEEETGGQQSPAEAPTFGKESKEA